MRQFKGVSPITFMESGNGTVMTKVRFPRMAPFSGLTSGRSTNNDDDVDLCLLLNCSGRDQ